MPLSSAAEPSANGPPVPQPPSRVAPSTAAPRSPAHPPRVNAVRPTPAASGLCIRVLSVVSCILVSARCGSVSPQGALRLLTIYAITDELARPSISTSLKPCGGKAHPACHGPAPDRLHI